MICVLALSKVSRFSVASVADQAGLKLSWSKIPEDTFLPDVAHILFFKCKVIIGLHCIMMLLYWFVSCSSLQYINCVQVATLLITKN